MTGKRNVDAVHVWLILSQASVAMLVRPYCVNSAAQETTAGEKHTAQTWWLMTKWLRQLFSMSGVRHRKMHWTKLGHKYGMDVNLWFQDASNFLNFKAVFQQLTGKDKGPSPKLPPYSSFHSFSPCMTMSPSISPFLSLTRNRYPLAEPIRNTSTPCFPVPYSLHRAQAINRAQNRVADRHW